MTVTPYDVNGAYAVGANWLSGANIISGIILGLVVAEMFTFIVRRNWVIRLPDSVPPSVSRSFSALIPGFIILSIMGIVSWALSGISSNFHQIIMDTVSTPLASMGNVVGWAYVVFTSIMVLWYPWFSRINRIRQRYNDTVGIRKRVFICRVWFS